MSKGTSVARRQFLAGAATAAAGMPFGVTRSLNAQFDLLERAGSARGA